MDIRVIYKNKSAGMVKANKLDQLLKEGQLTAYYKERWISVSGIHDNNCTKTDDVFLGISN